MSQRRLRWINHHTPWISEEQYTSSNCHESYPWQNDVTYLANGMGCRGRYCDDVRLSCDKWNLKEYCWASGCSRYYRLGNWMGNSYTNWGSEENGGVLTCPYGFYVSNVYCSGRYCDNLAFECKMYEFKQSHRDCWWGGWYSEEGSGYRYYDGEQHYLMAGIQCSGGYCDNKRNLYCR